MTANKNDFIRLDVQMLDKFTDGCMFIGRDWTYLYVNDTAAKHGLQKKENLIGKTVMEMYPGVEKTEIFAGYKRCMEKRVPESFEAPFLFLNGITRWYEIHVEPIDEGIFVVSVDITERKKKEEELKNTHESLERSLRFNEALLSSIPVPVFFKDRDGKYLGCNNAFTEIMGVTPEQIKGKTVFDLWPSEEAKVYHEKDLELMKNPIRQVYEFKIKDKGGVERPVVYGKDVFRNEDNQVMGLVGSFLDISEQKKLEEELEERGSDLNEAQRMAKIGSWKVSLAKEGQPQGTPSWSKQLYHIMGIDPSLPPPPYEEQLKFYVPEDSKRFNEGVLKAVQTGETYELEVKISETSGLKVKWGFVKGEAVRDEEGKITGLRGVFQDITEHKQVEERLKELDQLKNKFIQIVSHQLRTPLGVIRWNLEALLERERGEVSPAQMETLRSAYSADIEVISRINDLLTALDIEECRMILNASVVNIADLFQSVCEEALQACQLKNITYEIIGPKEPISPAQLDAEKIREVVSRLIDNAITYTNDNGKITVRYFEENGKIRFEVSDTGVGIPSSERHRIFERFHRGWNAGQMKPDASGLSLFISKHYIDGHRGTMGFTSEEKKGSTFWFELPLS